MSLDRHAADRRRFARLLGTDGDRGSGLPIGGDDSDGADADPDADADADDPPEADDTDSDDSSAD
ncbi:hypothetical protein NP511_06435 [Natrinema thermotolerans]|uniref:Uncharacterized protein n=1 Tax=Natrinema thermotolerans TaxID=121872 RepID=A0AAF0PF18_9EURY|nr:hypothetical protein [Natrinema thermotolerans]ELZ10523.1 hypothetical protein C478_13747 [Natrinema thermotolerans DSM 11552]QCC58161.1 hypothetical protein DVR14_05720 [Natrinema thermotolerans]WMT09269.1 hypothetical protein NP511_06435 [Natrinema thermotolerans]